MLEIKKRTFEALNYPKSSKERNKLNEEILTSEYQTSYKYIIELGGKYQLQTFKTRREAEEYIK
jgi:hypothetical protein